MRIRGSGWARRAVPLTSLIDVIFLLLLFFMLSTTFARYGAIDLASAAKGIAAAESPPKLTIAIGAEGGIEVNGESVALEDLTALLDRHAEAGEKRAVALLRGEVKVQRLVAVLEQGRRSRLEAITVVP